MRRYSAPAGADPAGRRFALVPGDTHSIRRVAEQLVRERVHRFADPAAESVRASRAETRPRAIQTPPAEPALRAVADLHAASRGNRDVVATLHPEHPGDWLIVAGDVAERLADVADVLATLAERFARVLWVPGNHELWGGREGIDGVPAPARYDVMVEVCRLLGVDTPEDPFPVWEGAGGPAQIVPLFLLYDYSWRPDPTQSKDEAVASARERRVVATDEYLIDPTPFPSIRAWCEDRLRRATTRLAGLDPAIPTVLINHWPLHREPTRALFYPDFAMWCGTEHTAQWPLRYNASACVYGHLHIPRTHLVEGVRYEEVSLGYPREWQRRGSPVPLARQILPVPEEPPVRWLADDTGAHIAAPGEVGTPFREQIDSETWAGVRRA